MSKPTPDLPEEQVIEELLSWIARLEEDGCPPTGDCENYILREETLAVDCEMCRKEELKKLLHSLGYEKVDRAAIERAAMERARDWIKKYPLGYGGSSFYLIDIELFESELLGDKIKKEGD